MVELPDDPSIDALEGDLRRRLASHWLHRAGSELAVGDAFAAYLPRLRGVGAADVVLTLAAKAIDDERRHADLCVRLAARYLGTGTPTIERREAPLQDFGTADEPTEVALLALGMCCINESIACEWIRTCWHIATSPLAIAANRHHLKDEIDHARLGWAHLASSAVDDALRARLRLWTPKFLAVNVAEWKKRDEHLPPEGIPEHGHLSAAENDAVIDAAVEDVVLPGLKLVGLA